MGDNNILARRARVGLTAQPSHTLTSNQLQQDAIGQSFVSQASNPKTLVAVTFAGAAFKGIQGLGYGRVLPYLADSKAASVLLKAGVNGLAVTGEAGVFVLTERGIQALDGSDPHALRWGGENGFKRAWQNAFINFSGLRVAAPFTAGQNPFVRNFGHSTAMVGANQFSAALGLLPPPSESISLQFVNASVMDLQMTAGMQMLHGIFPATALPSPRDPALWLRSGEREGTREYGMRFVVEPQVPQLAAEPGPLEKLGLKMIGSEFQGRSSEGMAWVSFRLKLALLGSEGKSHLSQELLKTMERPGLGEKDLQFALKALSLTLPGFTPEQRSSLLSQAQAAYGRLHDPAYRQAWIYLVAQIAPRLEGAEKFDAACLLMEAALSPYSGIANLAEESLSREMQGLSKRQLVQAGAILLRLEFQPELAGKRVRGIIANLALEIDAKREGNSVAESVEAARWFAQFMAHPEYRLGSEASLNWLELLKALPPAEARALIDASKGDMPAGPASHLYWAAFSQRQLGMGDLSELAKNWHQQRREIALARFSADLQALPLPREWADLSQRASRIRSVDEALQFQADFRAKLRSSDPAVQGLVENWWAGLPQAQRWSALQIFVGPDLYLPMKGAEALRWRRLAGQGLSHETGIASLQANLGEGDPALFVLGNRSTVGLPEAFVDQVGIEEAAQYLMNHHTHPHTASDLNQIYPSTFVEGGGSGDLHALMGRFEKLPEGGEIALSVTHALGGSIFALKKSQGRPQFSIYTGIRPGLTPSTIRDPRLAAVRQGIRAWAKGRGAELRFFELPYDGIEKMRYQGLGREISEP